MPMSGQVLVKTCEAIQNAVIVTSRSLLVLKNSTPEVESPKLETGVHRILRASAHTFAQKKSEISPGRRRRRHFQKLYLTKTVDVWTN